MQFNRRHAERVFAILEVKSKSSTHHVAGYLEIDGIRCLALHYPHSSKEFTTGFAHRFRKRLHLTVTEFQELISGRMTRPEYLAIVRGRMGGEWNY